MLDVTGDTYGRLMNGGTVARSSSTVERKYSRYVPRLSRMAGRPLALPVRYPAWDGRESRGPNLLERNTQLRWRNGRRGGLKKA